MSRRSILSCAVPRSRPGRARRWAARLVVVATVTVGLPGFAGAVAHAAGPCDVPVTNKVLCENTKAGTTDWQVPGTDTSILGFTTDISTNVGGRVDFKVQTGASSWSLYVYRLGWYGGSGGRLMATLGSFGAQPQTAGCAVVTTTALVDCGTWSVSASWTVPTDAVSGLYYAVVQRSDTGGESGIPFVVRDDSSHSDILFQTSDSTWQAYNQFGGSSLYFGTGPGPDGSAHAVSYNRPLDGTGGDENLPFNAEVPMLRFLERNGYDVSYFTDVDADRYGSLITNHKVYMPVGHDEYWSAGQRTNVEAARAAGVNMAFLTGNEIFWKVHYDASVDGTSTAARTITCYKETKSDGKIDPSPQWTGTWRDTRFSTDNTPENGLLGQIFMVNGHRVDRLQVPAAYGKMRLWRDTALAALADGSTYTFALGTLGYEWDEAEDNGYQPPGVAQLSRTTVVVPADPVNGQDQYILQNEGDVYGPGTATHAATLYRDQTSHALVFDAGTVQWAWGVDSYHAYHDHEGYGAPWTTVDHALQQATVNFLADMEVQPASLMDGLAVATASADTVAPTATIGTPSPSTLAAATPITFTGTVTDTGGQVAGVEVSTDGGTTWHYASWVAGSSTWTYQYTAGHSGTVALAVRAVDDSANLSTPVTHSYPIGQRTCPCTIWDSSVVPGTPEVADPNEYELGVKFQTSIDGYISAVKFYKSSKNTGTHTGTLWTSAGTQLATGTFTDETASGWQTLTFGTPVHVAANTTYVASYHTTAGYYAGDNDYFGNSAHDAEPMTALKDGTEGDNGVYHAGSHAFPTDSYQASNYWVDVVLTASRPDDTSAPTVSSVTPSSGATDVGLAQDVSVTFDEPVQASSLQLGVTAGGASTSGSVALSADRTAATFAPTEPLASATTYTVSSRATDDAGNTMAAAATWSFTTGQAQSSTCPCSIWDSFTTPDVANSADPSAVELGTKIRFDSAGYVSGVRFYKGSQNTGTHTGSLWSSPGTRLATGTFTGESASGWQTLTFASPVAVAANTTYVVSYHTNTGYYSSSSGYFASAGATNDKIHALQEGVDGGNGVYLYGPGGFPIYAWASTNYWVDVLYSSSSSSDTTPATVTAVTPASGSTSAALTGVTTATFSEAVDASTLQFELRDAGGALITGTIGYDPATRKATFTPSAALAGGATYTGRVQATDTSGNVMADPVTWTFTTTAAGSCPCSVFSPATQPTIVSAADNDSYELGMRFTPTANLSVTGVRFYKAADNTGVHTGSLWSSPGTKLATGTFSGESASGWQTLTFSSPVSVTADTPYVVSYSVSNGYYSADLRYFAGKSAVNGPLTAPASTSSAPNGLFGSLGSFPNQSYQDANYWVDVVATSTATGTSAKASASSASVEGTTTAATMTPTPTAAASTAAAPTTAQESGQPGPTPTAPASTQLPTDQTPVVQSEPTVSRQPRRRRRPAPDQ